MRHRNSISKYRIKIMYLSALCTTFDERRQISCNDLASTMTDEIKFHLIAQVHDMVVLIF